MEPDWSWINYLYVLAGYCTALITRRVQESYKYRYKWECPNCQTVVRASSSAVIARVKAGHLH